MVDQTTTVNDRVIISVDPAHGPDQACYAQYRQLPDGTIKFERALFVVPPAAPKPDSE